MTLVPFFSWKVGLCRVSPLTLPLKGQYPDKAHAWTSAVTVLCKSNENEFRQISTKSFEKLRKWAIFRTKRIFFQFFEAAIVLPFAKIRANPRKVGRNFERHFADSNEFSQLNSKRASKFRRLFRNIEKCLWPEDRDCCVTYYWNAIRWCVPMQIYSPRTVTVAFK